VINGVRFKCNRICGGKCNRSHALRLRSRKGSAPAKLKSHWQRRPNSESEGKFTKNEVNIVKTLLRVLRYLPHHRRRPKCSRSLKQKKMSSSDVFRKSSLAVGTYKVRTEIKLTERLQRTNEWAEKSAEYRESEKRKKNASKDPKSKTIILETPCAMKSMKSQAIKERM
jgi:hypothetical protein